MKRLCWLVPPLLAALVALFLSRRSHPVDAPGAPTTAEATGRPDAPVPGVEPASPVSPVAGRTETGLHGLRRLPEDVAVARGWRRPEVDTKAGSMDANWKQLAELRVSVRYENALLHEVLRDLKVRYGLDIHVDPRVPAERVRITFAVNDIRADQLLDLMLKCWDDPTAPEPESVEDPGERDENRLFLGADADGFLCVVRERDFTVTNSVHMQAYAIKTAKPPTGTLDEERAKRLKGPKVSPSLVYLPLLAAIEELLEARGMETRGYSSDAEEIARRAPAVSLIEEDMDLEDAVARILEPAGLALAADEEGLWICTAAEYRECQEEQRRAKADWARNEADQAALGRREVRIEGPLLALSDIAAQLEAQLGERVMLDPLDDDTGVRWESDGLPQTAKEVLDLLAREEGKIWRFSSPGFERNDADDVRGIWIVDRR